MAFMWTLDSQFHQIYHFLYLTVILFFYTLRERGIKEYMHTNNDVFDSIIRTDFTCIIAYYISYHVYILCILDRKHPKKKANKMIYHSSI